MGTKKSFKTINLSIILFLIRTLIIIILSFSEYSFYYSTVTADISFSEYNFNYYTVTADITFCAYVPVMIYSNADTYKSQILSDNKGKTGIYGPIMSQVKYMLVLL